MSSRLLSEASMNAVLPHALRWFTNSRKRSLGKFLDANVKRNETTFVRPNQQARFRAEHSLLLEIK